MQTSLQGIANKAQSDKKHRFGNLFGMLNEVFLWSCWPALRKEAASGVDRVTADEYHQHGTANVRNLVERLKRGAYRAKLVLRRWIPKGEGKSRPLGLPALEDTLLQSAVARILGSIFEADFLPSSYGYRPRKSAREAVKALRYTLHFGPYAYVVEADIRGFFDNIDHQWMIRMLEQRIDDAPFLRLIKKWLKAGILEEDGKVLHPATGTPQGGIVSPILANVYLHYALDLWFEHVVKKHSKGVVSLYRYADDFVCVAQYKEDAERFYRALPQRLSKFNLQVAEDKTRMMVFSRVQPGTSFDFLGFSFRWERSRQGKQVVKCRTSGQKFRRTMANFTEWCRAHRSMPLKRLFRALNAKLRGYYNYYGLIGNYDSLNAFFTQAMSLLWKWLNRRSQRRSYTWQRFEALLKRQQIERPRITDTPQYQLVLSSSWR
jgi:group II intron reverse transcriptase/maturase